MAIAATVHRHFILQQNKQAFNHSFSLQLLSLYCNAPRVYPIRALPRQNQYPRIALNIFPRLRVRGCLLRMAPGLRNTRTPLYSVEARKAGDITGSSLALEYWISSAASSRKRHDYYVRPVPPGASVSLTMTIREKLLCCSSAWRKTRYCIRTRSLRLGRHVEGKLQPAAIEAPSSLLIHAQQHAGK